jgi:threonine aldolase
LDLSGNRSVYPRASLLTGPKSISKIDMQPCRERYEFESDNTAAICPEAWAALKEANLDEAPSYGDDRWTARVRELVREVFETDCEVFFAFNGTAANALALAHLCQPFHGVICHKHAHIQTDECGAPEFFSGSKLLLVGGVNGKIDVGEAEAWIANQSEPHSPKPRALSITQSTELGTVYTEGEIHAVHELALQHSLFVHMDGARFANAVASLGCAPKMITWQAGVDVLCFGGTKNGTAAGELVVFFTKELAREFDYRLKQAGQLGSKMRFLAAPWVGLLNDAVWLRNAQQANRAARRLADELRSKAKIDIVFPVEANAVFVQMNERFADALRRRGWHFYKFMEPDIYRMMCSWAVSNLDIADLVADFRACQRSDRSPRVAAKARSLLL